MAFNSLYLRFLVVVVGWPPPSSLLSILFTWDSTTCAKSLFKISKIFQFSLLEIRKRGKSRGLNLMEELSILFTWDSRDTVKKNVGLTYFQFSLLEIPVLLNDTSQISSNFNSLYLRFHSIQPHGKVNPEPISILFTWDSLTYKKHTPNIKNTNFNSLYLRF